jgi:hypothetical protein
MAMTELDWGRAEDLLFERSREIIRQFAQAHPTELLSFFAYTVDSEYTGVALNFDTPANSLRKAKAHQRYEVDHRNRLFALAWGWENARYHVAHPTTQIDDFNRQGPWKYKLVEFVPLAAWEEYFRSSEEAPELEGRIISALWRVVDRLVEDKAFDGLRRAAPFRIGFGFHDDEMVVLRILDWPSAGPEGPAKQEAM